VILRRLSGQLVLLGFSFDSDLISVQFEIAVAAMHSRMCDAGEAKLSVLKSLQDRGFRIRLAMTHFSFITKQNMTSTMV
jgi:hypothetical protein